MRLVLPAVEKAVGLALAAVILVGHPPVWAADSTASVPPPLGRPLEMAPPLPGTEQQQTRASQREGQAPMVLATAKEAADLRDQAERIVIDAPPGSDLERMLSDGGLGSVDPRAHGQ